MSFCQFIYLSVLLTIYFFVLLSILFVLLSRHRSHVEQRQAPQEHQAGPWLPEAGRINSEGEQQQPHSHAQQLPPRGEIPQELPVAASAARTPIHPLLTDPRSPPAAGTRRRRCGPSCGAQLRLRAGAGPGRAGPGRAGPPAALATVARGGPAAKRAPRSTSGAPLPPSAPPPQPSGTGSAAGRGALRRGGRVAGLGRLRQVRTGAAGMGPAPAPGPGAGGAEPSAAGTARPASPRGAAP